MGIPGADDVMLHYQSTSFHDALYLRQLLRLKPAPEFEEWLQKMKLSDDGLQLNSVTNTHKLLQFPASI
jgi:ethanolamine ammonia-lyase large subunit